MPTGEAMDLARPVCPGTSTNVNHGLGKVTTTGNNQWIPCGKRMHWEQDRERWLCPEAHALSAHDAVEQFDVPIAA